MYRILACAGAVVKRPFSFERKWSASVSMRSRGAHHGGMMSGVCGSFATRGLMTSSVWRTEFFALGEFIELNGD